MNIKKKYEVLGVVGEGAYGIVYKCKNKETGKFVAIKKFKEVEDKLVQKTMRRELKMLQMLKHDNIVEFQDAFIYKQNLFIVFEYVEQNLLEVLEKSPDGLNPKLIRSFVFQMCKAVHYLHINKMIHRDVKPENLLIDENMKLKLCDFGFARKIILNDKNNNVDAMTDYVATRWYRSPELLLSNGIYGPEVDYWAIGCIMGELADGNPMFPGENEVDQLDCIIKILGNLPQELVNMFYENPTYNRRELLKVNRPESLERRYMGKLGPTAIDFLKGLLQLDPNKRINDETVFKHKYFSCFMKEPENQYILELIEKGKNTINNNDKNEKNNNMIKKEKSNIEIEEKNNNKKVIQTKVINNTTNINIINYNNYNENYKNYNVNNDNDNIDNADNNDYNDNCVEKNKEKKNESKNNISLKNNLSSKNLDEKTIKNNKNSNTNILDENNILNTKKSLSVNKTNKVGNFANMTISNNFHNIKLISLSQGKTNQKNNNLSNNNNNLNNNTNYNNIKNSTLNSFNVKKINIYESNYINNNNKTNVKSNNTKNNNNIFNDLSSFGNTNLDGYKTFFNINKSKDKYNFKINTGYVKEEGRKYANQNININNNIIDENEEYYDFNANKKKKNTSKDHKKNGQLFKYSDNYKYNFNNFNNFNNKNGGYGTFYQYKMKNTNFGGFGKKKNTSQLPNLFKGHNGNGSNPKNKFNNKNKFKYY